MPTFILPNALDANGDPVNGALAKVYLADGTTPATTYSDEAMSSANAWPIVYSAAGTPGACYVAEGEYKLDLQTSAGVSLDGYPKDDIAVFAFPVGLATGGTGTTTGPTLPTQTIVTTPTVGATYTLPSGCREIVVEVIGGGGGGGGVDGDGAGKAAIGGHGMPGARCIKRITSPASSYTYTVGAGGAGGASGANDGSAGTASTFTDGGAVNMSAGGGLGGKGMTAVADGGPSGVAVSTATGGDINEPGLFVPIGRVLGGLVASFGGPANSPRGSGGLGISVAGEGADATGYGAGGGPGATTGVVTDRTGGDGSGGIMIVTELY